MTSQVCLKNPNSSPFKNWISVGKYLDLRHKNVPYYGDLYAYTANNPVRYVDPDGREILVTGEDKNTYIWDDNLNDFYNKKTGVYGTKDEFVNAVKESLIYLKEGSSYATGVISEVSSSDSTAKIEANHHRHTGFYLKGIFKKNIYIQFDSTTGLSINDETNSFESPAMGLFHELCHAYSHMVEHKLLLRIKDKSVDPKWKNGEEYNAVQMSNRAAIELGEPIRNDYITARPWLYGCLPVKKFYNNQ